MDVYGQVRNHESWQWVHPWHSSSSADVYFQCLSIQEKDQKFFKNIDTVSKKKRFSIVNMRIIEQFNTFTFKSNRSMDLYISTDFFNRFLPKQGRGKEVNDFRRRSWGVGGINSTWGISMWFAWWVVRFLVLCWNHWELRGHSFHPSNFVIFSLSLRKWIDTMKYWSIS